MRRAAGWYGVAVVVAGLTGMATVPPPRADAPEWFSAADARHATLAAELEQLAHVLDGCAVLLGGIADELESYQGRPVGHRGT